MASLLTIDQLPKTSQDAIRAFDERYLAGLSVVTPPTWAQEYGDAFDVESPWTSFPIGYLTSKYRETKEQTSSFKTLEEDSFDVKAVEFDAGYEAKLLDLSTKTFAYRKWSQTPQRFIAAEGRHVNQNIVTLLEAGTSGTTPWDKLAFFSASHLSNPKDSGSATFSNYQSGALDCVSIANLSAEMTIMRGVLDENGDKLGVEPDTILVPTAKYQGVVNLLSQNLVNGGETNPLHGKLNPIHVPELTDVNDWYLVDSKLLAKFGLPPWAACRYAPPASLGLRYWDETSDFFKNTGKIKVSSHVWYGFGLVFPHAIRRVVGA